MHSTPIALFFLVIFSTIYLAALNRFLPVSIAAQAGSFVAIAILSSFHKFRVWHYLLVTVTMLLFPFQGIQTLFLVAFVASNLVASKLVDVNIHKIVLPVSAFICLLSLIHFYLDLDILYQRLEFTHYFFPSIYRLVGLDGSPAYLSFLAGLSAIMCVFLVRTRWISVCSTFFFLSVVSLTASRTALLGLGVSLVFGLARGLPFAAILGSLVLFPVAATLLYLMTPRLDISALMAIEQLTSNRVINWSNLLAYFAGTDPFSVFFGIGKPPVITDAQILESQNGFFRYSFVTYAESSILKILTYHGLVVFVVFFAFVVISSANLNSYFSRITVSYFIFSAIFYDAIFSMQYLYLSVLFFYAIARDFSLNRERGFP